MNFGQSVKEKREALHMTQEQLGKKVGVSLQMISQIERGQKTATIFVAADIAKAFGCSLDELTAEHCA